MRPAAPGDWLVVKGTHLQVPRRVGLVVEVRHTDGSPPFLVRWTDNDLETLVFPGPDAELFTEQELHAHDRR